MENYKKVQGDTYWWYDQKSKEKERREMGTDMEGKIPRKYKGIHIGGMIKNQKRRKDEKWELTWEGRENGSRFREMIRKVVDGGRKFQRKISLNEELEFEVSLARCHVVNSDFRGNEVAQLTVCTNSIIIRSGE
nr:hypothetical protein [Tanacetum cinerariifolium]